MIGIDTNVLVRIFAKDNDKQREAALRFLSARSEDDPVFVSALVVAEVAWVLERSYEFSPTAIHGALDWLFESANIVIERYDLLQAAVTVAATRNADISDCIIAAIAMEAGATKTVTFDGPAARRVPSMELLR